MKIGAQLYTLHNRTKTLEDFDEVLRRISELGFHYIQVSGTCAFDPKWLKERLDRYGLSCVLTHTPPAELLADPVQVAKNHDIFDCRYVGIGGMPRLWNYKEFSDQEVIDRFLAEYTPVLKAIREQGKYFMYHNHHFEFARLQNGKTMLEELVDRIPAEDMGFTLDTYWVQFGGVDPAKLIQKLSGRVPCVHFKDYQVLRCPAEEKNVRYAPVGAGNLDWDAIISACETAGTEYVLIEQDDCYGADEYECLAQSLAFLKSKGLQDK